MGAPGVDAEAWGAECARLAPQLLLKVTWDQLGWRHRVDVARQHAPSFAVHAPRVGPSLEAELALAERRQRDVAPMHAEHAQFAAELSAASDAHAACQRRVEEKARELAELEDGIRRAKQDASDRGDELGGQQPLTRIRGALKRLRAEVRSLSVREALTQQQLASKLGAKAAREADAERERRRRGNRPAPPAGGANRFGAAAAAPDELPDLTEDELGAGGAGA